MRRNWPLQPVGGDIHRNLALAFFAATTLISSSVNAQTAPVVLDDSVPAVSYYSALISGADQPGVGAGIQFPLTSNLLQPGVLKPSAVPVFNPKWMTQTLAIVGDDKGSEEWLKLHLERLLSLQATVIVVSAASENALKTSSDKPTHCQSSLIPATGYRAVLPQRM